MPWTDQISQILDAILFTKPHGGFVPNFTAASRRRREGLVATLTKYLGNTVEHPNLYSNIQRHLVYQTSRRLCIQLHGGTPRLRRPKRRAVSLGYAGRSGTTMKFKNEYGHYQTLRRHLRVQAAGAVGSYTHKPVLPARTITQNFGVKLFLCLDGFITHPPKLKIQGL
jgi:hypothetical protein